MLQLEPQQEREGLGARLGQSWVALWEEPGQLGPGLESEAGNEQQEEQLEQEKWQQGLQEGGQLELNGEKDRFYRFDSYNTLGALTVPSHAAGPRCLPVGPFPTPDTEPKEPKAGERQCESPWQQH